MRTTLNVADDVLLAVQERARRERRSAGDVLSDLARQALTGQQVPSGQPVPGRGEETDLHGFQPLPHRGPAVSNAFIDRLRDDDLG